MSNTVNNAIPFVPENTIDPAAGLNLSLNTIDALLQVLVQTVGANTPPAGVEGQRFIVGTAPTGAWAGQANKLARFLNGVWIFYDARYVVNAADGALYVRSGSVWTLFSPPIADNSVTNAKLADVATQTIKGRTTAGTGDPEDLTATQVRTLINVADGANAYTHPNHSGDVTSEGDGAQTIAANAVTNSKAADMAVNTIKGRITAGTGDPEDLTAAQARAVLALGSAATRDALGTTGSLYSRDSILGTVSQSGGVPTGAIIERGSNANGEYVRWADGTQICSGPIPSKTFPAGADIQFVDLAAVFSSFTGIAVTAGSPDLVSDTYGFIYATSFSMTQLRLVYRNGATAQGSGQGSYIVTGRWF